LLREEPERKSSIDSNPCFELVPRFDPFAELETLREAHSQFSQVTNLGPHSDRGHVSRPVEGDGPERKRGENPKRRHTENTVFALKLDGDQAPRLSFEFRSREARCDLDNPISLCRV